MPVSRAALKLGLQLIQEKLGQAMGVPGFSPFNTETPRSFEQLYRKPMATAKLRPPKIITPG